MEAKTTNRVETALDPHKRILASWEIETKPGYPPVPENRKVCLSTEMNRLEKGFYTIKVAAYLSTTKCGRGKPWKTAPQAKQSPPNRELLCWRQCGQRSSTRAIRMPRGAITCQKAAGRGNPKPKYMTRLGPPAKSWFLAG